MPQRSRIGSSTKRVETLPLQIPQVRENICVKKSVVYFSGFRLALCFFCWTESVPYIRFQRCLFIASFSSSRCRFCINAAFAQNLDRNSRYTQGADKSDAPVYLVPPGIGTIVEGWSLGGQMPSCWEFGRTKRRLTSFNCQIFSIRKAVISNF